MTYGDSFEGRDLRRYRTLRDALRTHWDDQQCDYLAWKLVLGGWSLRSEASEAVADEALARFERLQQNLLAAIAAAEPEPGYVWTDELRDILGTT